MEKSKRTRTMVQGVIIQGAICIGLLCLIWGGYFLATHFGTNKILEVKEDDFSWVYQVDSVEIGEKEFILHGFAFELDTDATKEAFEIVLQDVATKKRIFLETEYIEREDVNAYFRCEYDYSKSGFKAVCKKEKLVQKDVYEVLLRKSGKQTAYRTGIYIMEGQVMYANPTEFVPLEVAGTDLQKVIENGILRVYRPKDRIYVYQYEGELYWIAEQDYAFNEDGDVYVQYRLDTNQPGRLPKERVESQLDWDDCGFMFCGNELLDWDTGKYRVAKKKLPAEYSVTRICSGKYKGNWLWMQYFRPYYQFNQ